MNILSKYQTLIVGFLGFLGICITLLVNAYQERKLRLDEIAHRRRTLRVALLEELQAIRNALHDAVASLDANAPPDGHRIDSSVYLVPIYPINEVYKASIDRIGLLDPAETRKVINAHLTLDSMEHILPTIFDDEQQVKKLGSYALVPHRYGDKLLKLLQSVVLALDEAIITLKQSRG